MRVLITGGRGQLGAELAALLAATHDVHAPARAALDVTDHGSVGSAVAAFRPELVLHAAAWTDVDGAEADSAGAHRVNEHGSRVVARAARAIGAGLVAYSTDYVFPGDARDGYVESDPTGPRSIYGASKLAGELAVRDEHAGAQIVRTAWVFSPRGRNFLLTMLRAGAEQDELRVVDDQVGCPTATSHLAAATMQLVERCSAGTYHLAGGGSVSWNGFARAIMEEAGLPARVTAMSTAELARPAPRPACSILLSEHPEAPRLPPWRAGLRETLAELRLEARSPLP